VIDTERKPYFYMPQGKPARAKFESGAHSGRLRISITARTPLHFGAGLLGVQDESFVHLLSRENGRISLPGSGFKGALRALYEALSDSCNPGSPASHCVDKNELCPACALFGFMNQRQTRKGKLHFTSFAAEGATQILWLPQLRAPKPPDEPLRKFYKHSQGWGDITESSIGRKNASQLECLLPGAALEGAVIYQGLTENELGGLLFALGLGWDPPAYHKLGYGKPAYFGSASLTARQGAAQNTLFPSDNFTPDELAAIARRWRERHEANAKVFEKEWTSIGSGQHWDLATLTY